MEHMIFSQLGIESIGSAVIFITFKMSDESVSVVGLYTEFVHI